MDIWERFYETFLPNKKAFYSELNLEDITDKDFEHAQKVQEVFEIKNLGECHDLYVQSDTLLLTLLHYCSAPGVNLELLTNIDTLLMVEKGIRG